MCAYFMNLSLSVNTFLECTYLDVQLDNDVYIKECQESTHSHVSCIKIAKT